MLEKLKIFAVLSTFILTTNFVFAAISPSNYMSANSYNNLYPYMNNTMRTSLNPGTTPSQSNAQINVLTRTKTATNNTQTRKVVPRSATTTTTSAARSATNSGVTTTAARNAVQPTTTTTTRRVNTNNNTQARMATTSANTSTRRVVARSGTTTNTMQAATRTSRGDASYTQTNQNSTGVVTAASTGTSISSARCMADYIECMNGYCEREDTAYNRCYCSSKLAQIDSTYQPEIDRLIKEILTLKSTNKWTEEEMNKYWMDTVGKYTGDNSWVNLDDALNIDWASTESRVRGQQAFTMGHNYCMQHLSACAYMSNNLRDAYRSEISRDCSAYETSLQKVKTAAESIVEAYK